MSDSDNVQTVIYYDEDYPSAWISDGKGYPRRISQYLEKQGIEIKKADELREFIIDSIERGNSSKKFIVFSQDIIPDTIVENYTSNTTLREFLDQGGSILWMGDIPGFYIGKRVKICDEGAGKSGAPVLIFGVVPIFAHTVKKGVVITNDGEDLCLKHKWSGVRPILPDTGIDPLAESEAIYALPYITNIETKEVVDQRKKLPQKRGLEIEAGIPLFKIGYRTEKEVGEVGGEVGLQYIHEIFPNAWHKSYNWNYLVSGVYRIWDFEPQNFPDVLLEELYSIIKSIEARLKRGTK
jgi:hypothetical protein